MGGLRNQFRQGETERVASSPRTPGDLDVIFYFRVSATTTTYSLSLSSLLTQDPRPILPERAHP